ncbi:hypothetical protein [Dokdonia sp.]|uniref:hypothetical protein n=1 Tax=Dokdonia sp. TaxID=2024995 RepID=UPI00326721B9
MSDYILTINFTDEQLNDIYNTDTRVILGKQAGGGEPHVAWQSFNPFQSNQVNWIEEYGIYVSNTQAQHGAALTQLSSIPIGAATGKLYTLEPSGVISGPDTGGMANAFALLNQYSNQDYITVGLYQDAIVNGIEIIRNAVSAAPVLLASTTIMTPSITLYIWLQSQVTGNSVVTTVTSPMTELVFGGGISQTSVSYDTQTGMFIIQS